MIKRAKRIPEDRRCYKCHNKQTYRTKRRFYIWYNYGNNHLCLKCYQRIIIGSKYYFRRREYKRAIQREYYLRVTKPKLEARKKQLVLLGIENN